MLLTNDITTSWLSLIEIVGDGGLEQITEKLMYKIWNFRLYMFVNDKGLLAQPQKLNPFRDHFETTHEYNKWAKWTLMNNNVTKDTREVWIDYIRIGNIIGDW